jgi:cobalt/nickel transport system permease protein
MTHMHIPDGILPVWLWVSGFILMAIMLGFSLLQLRNMDMKRKIPLLGAVAAAMLVAMSLEIFIIGYHINLSVAAGILLGPALGFVAAFIANLMLAFMGHGGITVIGLNTLLLGSEAVLGHTVFFLLKKRLPVFWRAAAATVLAQFVTTLLLIGIVAVSRVNPALFGHEEEHTGAIRDSVRMFAAVVLSLGSIGWVIEAAITGSVMKFISQVKPDLLGHVLHRDKSEER